MGLILADTEQAPLPTGGAAPPTCRQGPAPSTLYTARKRPNPARINMTAPFGPWEDRLAALAALPHAHGHQRPDTKGLPTRPTRRRGPLAYHL